jgi:hypothetical protein
MASTITVAAAITSTIVNPRERAGRLVLCGTRQWRIAQYMVLGRGIGIIGQTLD